MSSLKDLASLIMIPSLYKDGELHTVKPLADENIIVHPDATDNNDGVDGSTPSTSSNFTFSRGSNLAATRVDVNGLIEKGRENLVLQSNQFDTTWSKNNATLTSGQSAYDGSSDAWKLGATANGGSAYISNAVSLTSIKSCSVYAKAGSYDYIIVQCGGGTASYTWFDLTNGAVGTEINVIDSKIELIGNGWYRCSITAQGTHTGATIYAAPSNGGVSVSAGNYIYIQDAQLEQGLVATDYIETTTTSVSAGILEDMPRLDYSGGASCPSLLLEPSRTNLVTNSEWLEGSFSLASFATISLENVTAPDGSNLVTKAQANGDDAGRVQDGLGTLGTNHIWSGFFKGTGVATRIRLRNNQGEQVQYNIDASGNFSLHSEDAVNGNYDIEDYGNGWYRIWFETTTTAATTNYVQIYPDMIDGDGSVYAWGLQAEQGSYPTSYIPTYGTSQTRSLDAMNNSSLGLTDCTFFVDFVPLSSVMGLLDFYDNSNARIFYIAINSIKYLTFNSVQGGTIGDVLGPLTIGDRYKLAFTLNASTGDVTIFVNGTKYSTYSTTISSLNKILQVSSFGYYNNTEFNQILAFPTALTDSECIALTTL